MKLFSLKFTITNAIAAGLTKIERVSDFLDAAKLSEDWTSETQNRALVYQKRHTPHFKTQHASLEHIGENVELLKEEIA